MNEKLVRRGAGLAIGVAAVMLLLALGDRILRVNSQQMEVNRSYLFHTIDVLGAARSVGISVRDAEIGRRGYIFAEDRSYVGPYLKSADTVRSDLANLVSLTMGDAIENQLVAQLRTAVMRQLASVDGTVRLLDTLGAAEAQRVLRADALSDPMSEIRNLVDAIVARENQLFTNRVDQTAQAQRRATIIALVTFGGALAILLASGAALFFGWRRSYRMQRVLQATVNGTSRAIAAFEKERLVAWNKRFVELLGKKGSLAAVGTSTRELETAESGTLLADLTAQLNRAHKYRRPIASERTRPDGKIYELLYSAPHDGIAVFSAFDATEKRQSERFLQNAQKMDALGQMTGGIAHDFNNLLTVMLMNLDVMQEDPALQPRFGRRMELMSAAAQKGTLLVQQLLAYARKQPLEPEVVDLRELVPGLVELIKRTIGEDVEVRADLGPDLWMTILDPAQFESTVLNLALNARDAMPEGGKFTLELANLTIGEASVAPQADMATGDYVVITVMDTGCGMSAEVMARAFEPFFTTKGNGRGNGLGLSMVYGFVKQTGGHIEIDSEPGRGTTVKFYLPRCQENNLAAASPTPTPTPKGDETILVVEDDDRLRATMVSTLNTLGYETLQASDGQSALHVLENGTRVDLLFTDMILSGPIDGRKLADAARELRPEIKILYTSGYAERAEQLCAQSDPAIGLLNKPYCVEELATELKRALAS